MENDRRPDDAPCGILSYGHYVPVFRLAISALAEQWAVSEALERAYRMLGRATLALAARDEDVVTMSIDAVERLLLLRPEGTARPRSLLVGSESHPYAVKPTSVIVAEAVGLTPDVFVSDLEFACKGGTAALFLSLGAVTAGLTETAIAVGADCPQSAPGSLLEASVGAAACALLIGRGPIIAQIDCVTAASSDVTDFWRRDTARFPSVVGKFSVDVGYMQHCCAVIDQLLSRTGTRPEDYAYLCLHQPYQSLPLAVAQRMGFHRRQVQRGLLAGRIGNTYSSACLLALCSAFEVAEPGQRVMLVSFGSGAGSDGFVLTVTPEILAFRRRAAEHGISGLQVESGDEHGQYVTYGQYCLMQEKLRQ